MLLLISGGFIPSDKGAGGGHSYPGIRGGGAVSKKLFSPLRATVWSEHKGVGWGPGLPGPSPGSATAYGSFEAIICFRFNQRSITKSIPILNYSSQKYL